MIELLSCRRAQAWREDRTLIAAGDMIADALGQRFVESVPLNMEAAWAESRPTTPLICLLSPGAPSVTKITHKVRRDLHHCAWLEPYLAATDDPWGKS